MSRENRQALLLCRMMTRAGQNDASNSASAPATRLVAEGKGRTGQEPGQSGRADSLFLQARTHAHPTSVTVSRVQ